MKKAFRHIHHHLKRHHRKYLFGIFGGFAVVKLFILVFGLGAFQYAYQSIFADLDSGCVLTGQYYTGEYLTGGYLTGQELTDAYLTGCTVVPGYWTGGALDESGTLTGQTRVDESQTGCELTGQLIGGYLTGQELTGGYWTGGTCITYTGTENTGSVNTGTENTGSVNTGTENTGTVNTGTVNTGSLVVSGNSVCDSTDIIRGSPVSGSVVSNIFPISWTYSGVDCLTGLSLQLWDHNDQWISLKNITSGSTGYLFDSKSLSSFQQSGLYHVIGTGTTGQYYLYTGIATGTYSRLFSGYKFRLITSDQTPIYESQSFIINNEIASLTGISLVSSGSSTGYLTVSGMVTLSFTANQQLTGLHVTLGSNKIPSSNAISGLLYTYTWTLSSGYTEGPLVATIAFTDALGNTGTVIYTGSLIFDAAFPIVSGFEFSGYASGVYLNFTSSEPVKYDISYHKSGSGNITGMTSEYLTAQQFNFGGIERTQLYMFTLNIYDRVGNMRSVTGDVLQTALGTVLSHTYIVPLATSVRETALSGTLSTLADVLRREVEKFNTCKNSLSYTPVDIDVRDTTFTLHMPMFQKTQMKTLVNAFTLFVLDKVKHNYAMTSGNIAEMTKKFDNFLIILKLLRDDDNSCKQNLSNYHVSQFQNALNEYNITLE